MEVKPPGAGPIKGPGEFKRPEPSKELLAIRDKVKSAVHHSLASHNYQTNPPSKLWEKAAQIIRDKI